MNTNGKKVKMQGKKPSHRNAIVKSLLIELIRNESIKTTPAKARILKQQFDILVNEAKKNTLASKRNVESALTSDKSVTKLYGNLLPRLEKDNSGYTQSARTLPRKGDNAPQMIVLIKGTELKENKSKLEKALARKEKKAASKPAGVTERIREAVGGRQDTKSKQQLAKTRRNSM
jgi:large subunit ribosomal protein L17